MVERSKYREQLEKELKKLDEEDDKLVSILHPIIQDGSFCICRNETDTIYLNIKTPKQRFITHKIINEALCNKAGFDAECFSKEQKFIQLKTLKKIFTICQKHLLLILD